MEKVTFVIDDNKDADLLISIAQKLGIRKFRVSIKSWGVDHKSITFQKTKTTSKR